MTQKLHIPLLFSLALVLLVLGCKPERATLGPPSSKLEGINDSFVLEKVIQVDMADALAPELDITDAYLGANPMVITFNSTDFTWNITENDSPNFMGASGSWAFDDNEYPTLINLTDGSSGITQVLPLDATIRETDNLLKFTFSKGCGSDITVGYKYEFRRM